MENLNTKATLSIFGACAKPCVEDITRSPIPETRTANQGLGGTGVSGSIAGAFGPKHIYITIWQ